MENLKEFWLKEPESIGCDIQYCSPHLTSSHLEIYNSTTDNLAHVTAQQIYLMLEPRRGRELRTENCVYFSTKTNLTLLACCEPNDA